MIDLPARPPSVDPTGGPRATSRPATPGPSTPTSATCSSRRTARYFAIATSGGGNTGTLCDTAARFETAATGDDVQPTWAAYTGGDSLLSVEVTGTRDLRRRPPALDEQRPTAATSPPPAPCPGRASRALDPRTGVPLAWNPGRNPRGVGAEALLATADRPLRRHGHPLDRQPPLPAGPASRSSRSPAARPALGDQPAPSRRTCTRRRPPQRRPGGRAPATSSSGSTPAAREVPATDGGPHWTADDGT